MNTKYLVIRLFFETITRCKIVTCSWPRCIVSLIILKFILIKQMLHLGHWFQVKPIHCDDFHFNYFKTCIIMFNLVFLSLYFEYKCLTFNNIPSLLILKLTKVLSAKICLKLFTKFYFFLFWNCCSFPSSYTLIILF